MAVFDRRSLAVAALAVLPLAVAAQAQFSISNPLVKPQSRRLAAASAPSAAKEAAQEARVPVARPVSDGAPPWPATGGGLPSQNGESAAKEELSSYTVVAIVGDAAVLRTNVGLVAAHASPPSGGNTNTAMPAPPGGQAQQHAPRQQAMRVRTGQPMLVAGTSVVPLVGASTVEFRSASGKGGLLFTASLDSQSPQAFVPATREAADPAVAARATPTPPNITGIAPAGANGATGAAPGAAGTSSIGR
jgi:hypothetical protein